MTTTTLDLTAKNTQSVQSYIKSGQPWVWLTAAAISVAFIITVSLLCLTAARGLPHFWPGDLVKADYAAPGEPVVPILVEIVSEEEVSTGVTRAAGFLRHLLRSHRHVMLLRIGEHARQGTGDDCLLRSHG